MKAKRSERSTTVRRRIHRRRYRESSLRRYDIERYLEPLYAGARTVDELRDRYRRFADDDSIWHAIGQFRDTQLHAQQALEDFDKAIKRAFRPATPPRPKGAKRK